MSNILVFKIKKITYFKLIAFIIGVIFIIIKNGIACQCAELKTMFGY